MLNLRDTWEVIKDKLIGSRYRAPLIACPVPEFIELPTISGFNSVAFDIQQELAETRRSASAILTSLVRSSEEERRRLELIFDSIGDAILLIDENGEITACNRTARQLLSLSSENLIGQRICEHVPEICEKIGTIIELRDSYTSYLKSGWCLMKCPNGCKHTCTPEELSDQYAEYLRKVETPLNTAIRFDYLRPDGTTVQLQIVINILTLNPYATTFGFVIVLRDLTRATYWEDSALHMQSASSGLMSLLSVPVFYKDAEYHFTSVNKPLRDLLNVVDEEIIGKTVFEIFEQSCAEQLDQFDRSVSASNETQQVTLPLHTLKGIVQTVNVISRAIRTGKKVTGVTGAIINKEPINERTRSSIFAAAAKAVVFTGADDLVVGCNDEFLRLSALQKSQVIGKSINSTELASLLSGCELLVSDTVQLGTLEYGRIRLPVVESTGDATSSVYVLFQNL